MKAQSIISPDLFGVPTFHIHISHGKISFWVERGHLVFHTIEEVGSLPRIHLRFGFIGLASLVVLFQDLIQ